MHTHGKYIVIEGGADGIGKSTQAKKLVDELNSCGINAIYVHEPGEGLDDTQVENHIERLVKDINIDMNPAENLLAFTIARSAVYRKRIEPNISKGIWVISDRNWLSSAAYQGHAEGLGINLAFDITSNFMPKSYMYPDLTILANIEDKYRLKRSNTRGTTDTFESKGEAFQQKVIDGYKIIINKYTKNTINVSFNDSIDEIHEVLLGHVKTFFSIDTI